MSTEARPQKRLPYEKPKLRVIDLAAEEVLGVGCKMGGSRAERNNTCISGSCSALGS